MAVVHRFNKELRSSKNLMGTAAHSETASTRSTKFNVKFDPSSHASIVSFNIKCKLSELSFGAHIRNASRRRRIWSLVRYEAMQAW